MQRILAGLALVALTVGPALAAPKLPAFVSAAVTDTARPDGDKQADAERKPAEMLLFAHIRPGMRVMDVWPGRGYFTRLFAKAVGPKGHVYSYQPAELDAMLKGKTAPIYDVAAGYDNVSVLHAPLNALTAPEFLDMVWTSQNYHDMHDSFAAPADLARMNHAIFEALKPGGYFVIADHAGRPGTGISESGTLHRIEESFLRGEVEAAGFKLAGESNLLRNPKDPRTATIFDPSIKGQTDQFVLRFVKPKH